MPPARTASPPASPGPRDRITSRQTEPDERKWKQIAALVRQQIDDGTLTPGDLVSAAALAQQHGIGRQTAAKGLRALTAEGRLASWPGYGYTVQVTTSPRQPSALASVTPGHPPRPAAAPEPPRPHEEGAA